MKHFPIRTARAKDLAAVALIEDDSFPSPYPAELFKKLLKDHADSFFVAEDSSGKIIGYCIATADERFAHLISIAVLHEYRHRGVGTALLIHLAKHLLALRIDEIWLEVNTENREAIELYERFGFTKVMILENYYSDGASALRMRLEMTNAVLNARREGG